MNRQAKRVRRELTPAESERYRKALAETEAEKDQIIGRGRQLKTAAQAAAARLREAFRLLKEERARQGLSLRELEERTGIPYSALSRLETDPEANPTVTTLERCAKALGMTIQISLVAIAR
jgi:DNA-binding Xre family transcriptional regulator